ncbi:hypothetical protein RHMOL_Rhmol03G0098300 [Rhododendron molle]|uniref:Uncharacterized protein n=1 Tax=Rhododendron molle TaxID=49168 RepID=A0ACC0PCU7_RHOML|nr:hypothetical protein RHMOL_Rhmol03G0098300 [Rhododendron molle]
MASSSSGNAIPAPNAVRVLVSSLADESPMVREASRASIKDIALLNPLLVLDCCSTVSRGGRRELHADWQGTCSNRLTFARLGNFFDLVARPMRAIIDDGRIVSSSIRAKFGSSSYGSSTCRLCFCRSMQFTPRLKGVLLRVLPILGNVTEAHHPIFANGVVIFLDSLLQIVY